MIAQAAHRYWRSAACVPGLGLAPVWAVMLALIFAGPGMAEQTQERYSVRALGVKVGEMALVGRTTDTGYKVRSEFSTTGLVGAVKGVKFILSAEGARRGKTFLPQRYDEEMDTGERVSQARLIYSGGIARAEGPGIDKTRRHKVSNAQQKGAVDPLTAIFMVLRHQPEEGLCNFTQNLYDGERLSQVRFGAPKSKGKTRVCSGEFRRLAGYKPEDLENGRFGLSVTYEPAGDGLMRAVSMRADTIYGPATLVRK